MKNQLKHFVIEITWLTCTEHGWGNGYVAIPKDHPLYGKHYDDEAASHIEAHGGLTFSDFAKNMNGVPEEIQGDYWVFGFDTAHFGDTISRWPKKAVNAEAWHLKVQLEKMYQPQIQ